MLEKSQVIDMLKEYELHHMQQEWGAEKQHLLGLASLAVAAIGIFAYYDTIFSDNGLKEILLIGGAFLSLVANTWSRLFISAKHNTAAREYRKKIDGIIREENQQGRSVCDSLRDREGDIYKNQFWWISITGGILHSLAAIAICAPVVIILFF